MADIYMKKGNRLPYIRRQLVNPDGSIPNLTGVNVTWRMGKKDGSTDKVAAGAVVKIDAAQGIVEWQWPESSPNASDTPGDWYAQFDADFGSGVILSYPSNDWIHILISENA